MTKLTGRRRCRCRVDCGPAGAHHTHFHPLRSQKCDISQMRAGSCRACGPKSTRTLTKICWMVRPRARDTHSARCGCVCGCVCVLGCQKANNVMVLHGKARKRMRRVWLHTEPFPARDECNKVNKVCACVCVCVQTPLFMI